LETDTGFVRTGGVYLVEESVATGFGGHISVDARVMAQRGLGIATEKWSAAQVAASLPGVSPSAVCGVYTPNDGIASHAQTTDAYATACRNDGNISIVEGAEVRRVSSLADGSLHVGCVGGSRYRARSVLLANNAGMETLVDTSFGIRLPLWTIAPMSIFVDPVSRPMIPLLVGHDTKNMSVKVLDDGSVMLSGGWRGSIDDSGRGLATKEVANSALEVMYEVFPYLRGSTITHVEASRIESVSADLIPIIDWISPGVMIAGGWSGHGWALAPAVGRHLARSLVAGHLVDELKPFSLSRFCPR